VLPSYPFCFFSDAFRAEQEGLKSEASTFSTKRKRRRTSEDGGSDSQVVVVVVHRNASCFDVCVPKLWIQLICQCGVISNRRRKACIEFWAYRLKPVVLTSHYLCTITQRLLKLCGNCVITRRTSVHQSYSVWRQLVQTWSCHVTSKHWVLRYMNQIIFFAIIAIL